MARIFISHSSLNNAEAIAVRDWLVANGWEDIFLDLDPHHGLRVGERWQEALKAAAHRCQVVVFLITPEWVASKWCLAEFLLAKQLNKRLFGVLVAETPFDDLPTEMTAEWQLVDLAAEPRLVKMKVELPSGKKTATVSFSEDGLSRLKIGLQSAGLDAAYFAWPPQDDSDRPPYRGLRPLEAEDAGIFFGRDGAIVEALDRLRGLREAAPPRLFVILGASGSGKSSFLRAGLLPRLARDDRHFLPLPVLRPEGAAITGETGLISRLTAAFKARGIGKTRAAVRAAVEGGGATLQSLLSELVQSSEHKDTGKDTEPSPPTLIVPIDQAEELYLAEGLAEADGLLALLKSLLDQDTLNMMVVLTIRSDAYERLQLDERLEGLRQQTMSLPPMPRGAYGDVISGPALRLAATGRPLKIEDQLTDAILTDIEEGGAKDALPLLAFTMERLYLEYGDDGDLTLSEYEELGRIRGSIEAAVERALKAADSDPAAPKDRAARLALLRRGLIPWLAGIDPDTGEPRRRVARLSEIPDEARPLIRHLVEQRLLATDVAQDTADVTIEPAHESLLRQWGLLEGWLEEDFEALTTLDGVKRATRDWLANDRDHSWLSHNGARLEVAERTAKRDDFADHLRSSERKYLAAARQREDERISIERRARDAELRERRSVQIAESKKLTALAAERLADGDAATAALLALEALSDSDDDRFAGESRPYLREAEVCLDMAYRQIVPPVLLAGHSEAVNCIAVSPSGDLLVTGSDDCTARVWDISSGAEVSCLAGHDGGINCVSFMNDGSRIVTGSSDGSARIWNYKTKKQLATMGKYEFSIGCLVVARDDSTIATGSDGKVINRWNPANGENLASVRFHRGEVRCMELSTDGSRLAVVLNGQPSSWVLELHRWDTGRTLDGHTKGVSCVAISPDGSKAVTGSLDNSVRVWDIENSNELAVLAGHRRSVTIVAVMPDCRRVISGAYDGSVKIWDIESRSEIADCKGHTAQVTGIAIAFEGKRILSASRDESLRVWDAETGTELAVLRHHAAPITALVALPSHNAVASASQDSSVRICSLFENASTLVEAAKRAVPHCLSPEQRKQHSLGAEPPFWCIDMGKLPYDTDEWRAWLAERRAGGNPAMPN
jgi:WD40 repeat protein